MSTSQSLAPGDDPHCLKDPLFLKACAEWDATRRKPGAPWVLALPRPDFDPASKRIATSHAELKIDAKSNQVAVMQVIAVGKGRTRLGYREHIPVSRGELVLVNLREAGHWLYLGGELRYLFTGDVAIATMYRTQKTPEAPPFGCRDREEWEEAWFWNIERVLNDYMLLGRDPDTERLMRNGPASSIHLPQNLMSDGMRSDNSRDNRFPIVYRRVLGVGPGRWLTRESDLGIVEREETKSEAQAGDMLCMCRTVAAAQFMFQGAPLEAIHAASLLISEPPPGALLPALEVHDSVPQPIPYDLPNEDEEPDPDPPSDEQPETERVYPKGYGEPAH